MTASCAVRAAVPDDVPALAALAALTFPLACPPGSTPEDQQAFITSVLSPGRFASYLASPERSVLVAEQGGALVGYTMLVLTAPTDPDVAGALTLTPTVELSKCYVHPAHHGAGIAHALMESSLAVAQGHGAAGIWLGVNQENARARAFYERSGFSVVGTKHFTVGTRLENDYVLERPL
ncbi:GNAT family N-acetyltransferase [Cellulomonas sp. URHE0023]|uniref:GNAT family N-acetyltransferase n=1 Tax=Cellulomonas sp. URHE0023 TaxID=1380354 RepID=UPI000481DCDA|nr:GNAT family N-acetyltransferase [Cellulomonas sp. URHE0023]